MTTSRILRAIALWLVLGLALAGCPAPATPTPRPAPTPSPAPTASPTPAPAAPTPAGWQQHDTPALSLSLPATWPVLPVGEGDAQKLFSDFQARNPDLAKVIGSAAALQGTAFWAFNATPSPTGFVDNLNIRRSALGGQKVDDLAPALDAVAAQYEQLKFKVLAKQAGLTIGGRPAGRITYTFPLAATDGSALTAEGTQYLVATATDLWVLTFTAGPGRTAALASAFEQSAQSFRVK